MFSLVFIYMYSASPTKAEVDRYFEENKCVYCDGDVYGEVYLMKRQTAMLWGQIFRIPLWWIAPKFILYITTPFNYYNDINHREDEFHTYTWVDTREGRFVYNAVSGDYVKEIDKTINPDVTYGKQMNDYFEKLKALQASAECSYNAYDCADFKTQAEAQTVMKYCGNDDIHYLDRDDDGIACEALP